MGFWPVYSTRQESLLWSRPSFQSENSWSPAQPSWLYSTSGHMVPDQGHFAACRILTLDKTTDARCPQQQRYFKTWPLSLCVIMTWNLLPRHPRPPGCTKLYSISILFSVPGSISVSIFGSLSLFFFSPSPNLMWLFQWTRYGNLLVQHWLDLPLSQSGVRIRVSEWDTAFRVLQ